MALQDYLGGINIFGTPIPTGILDPQQEEKLRNQAMVSGLIGTAANYLATPKNLGAGSPLPYLARAYVGGMGASQGTVDTALNNLYRQQLIAARDDSDRLYNVDGALVDRAGQVVYQSPTKQQKRDTAVVDGVVVDVNTGEAVYTSPKQQKLNTEIIDVGGKKILINKDTGAPIQEYKTVTQPKDVNYTIQTDASGQAVYVPNVPGAQALDMQGRPTTYKPAPTAAEAKVQEKQAQAKKLPALINEAESLLKDATGSYLGAARDIAAATVGQSTKGARNIASLKGIEANLILSMPRLEGPQSNLDQQLYRQAAGQIGDPTVPNETKMAALQTIKRINTQYGDNAMQNQPSLEPVKQTTTGGFKEGAKTKSKSGKPMVFRNGQWEYE
jgi:hypothetical protein